MLPSCKGCTGHAASSIIIIRRCIKGIIVIVMGFSGGCARIYACHVGVCVCGSPRASCLMVVIVFGLIVCFVYVVLFVLFDLCSLLLFVLTAFLFYGVCFIVFYFILSICA